MSSELLNALESKVTTAVSTIEDLRAEIKVLKEERQILEGKLRELLQKIEGVDNGSASPEASPDQRIDNAGQPIERPNMGFGASGDY